jgi:hypothetical protein
MAEEKKENVYECEQCGNCFSRQSDANRIYDQCPGGTGTWSHKLTGKEIEFKRKNNGRKAKGRVE